MTNTTEPTITNVLSDDLDILDIALFPDEIKADDYTWDDLGPCSICGNANAEDDHAACVEAVNAYLLSSKNKESNKTE